MKENETTELERKYKDLEFRYRKLYQAIECSPASVIITDRGGHIEYINPKFTEITGYSLEEIKGRNPRILKSGKTPREVFVEMWETITQGREWRGEFINRKKDGDLYTEFACIAPITDDKGEITNFVAVKQDISQQKEAEKAKADAYAFLQSVMDTVPEPIMVINLNHEVIAMNRVVQKEWLKGDTGILPKCYEISHNRQTPCEGANHPCPLEAISRSRKPVKMVHTHFTASGEKRYVEIMAAPFWNTKGEFDGIIESTRDMTERIQAAEKLEYLAHYDNLTGIPNRLLFYDRLKHTIERSRREWSKFALLFIDLDGFKKVNDTYGHAIGDLLLQEVAAKLKQCTRKSDTVARMGGDEFTIILANIKTHGDADMVAANIVRTIAVEYHLRDVVCRVGASIGISRYPDDDDTYEGLLKKADQAMYMIKESKKEAGPDGQPVYSRE